MRTNDDFSDQDSFLEAVQRFEEMLENEKELYFDVEELEGIIDYYLDIEDVESALIASKHADWLHPDSIGIKIRKAFILIEENKLVEAQGLISQIDLFEQENVDMFMAKLRLALHADKVEEANLIAQTILDLNMADRFEMLYDIALQYNRTFNFIQAETFLREAFELEPEDEDISHKLAEQYVLMGEIEKALGIYINMLDFNPFSEHTWYNYALTLTLALRNDEALEAYDYSLAINPSFTLPLINKGLLYMQLNDLEKAVAVFKEMVEDGQDLVQANFYLGLCLIQQNKDKEAIPHFYRVTKIDTGFHEAYYYLSTAYFNLDLLMLASDNIELALQYEPNNAEYLFQKGKVLLKQGYLHISLEWFRKARTEDASDVESWCMVGFVLKQMEEEERAVIELQKGLEFNPDDPELQFHLAASYHFANNKKMALEHFRKAMELNDSYYEDLLEYYPTLVQVDYFQEVVNELRESN